jgi:hypothetical protein
MLTYAGAVASLVIANHGAIIHASASGIISAAIGSNTQEAGLVLNNYGTISRSHAAVDMSHSSDVGGLVLGNEGAISLSYATGSISASSAGGLAEWSSGMISDSYALGDVSVGGNGYETAGGLVARSYGPILRCFEVGTVIGSEGTRAKYPAGKLGGMILGGLTGYSNGPIAYSYAIGGVTGTDSRSTKPSSLGGLIGVTGSISTILQGYSLGNVKLNARRYIGGSLGKDLSPQGNNNTVYWDLDTSGIENPTQGAGNVYNDKGLKGLSEAQFRRAAMRHFDPAVWGESASINNGYPYLLANPPPQ